jgi:hypothetical protein
MGFAQGVEEIEEGWEVCDFARGDFDSGEKRNNPAGMRSVAQKMENPGFSGSMDGNVEERQSTALM